MMQYLAMAGFDVSQIIASMPGVLNLAAAAQLDLGSSADIVSNIMTGFGLSADETGRAVDVLVETMTSANTDLPQLGHAMKYVAPVASALGLSIEETATAVAKMSDAGIQGGKAGTSLRAALLSLANPTGQTTKAFKKLGIEVTTSEGTMKPLPELIGHINEKLDGMTEAQKTQTVAQLVGREAASGFIALLNVGEKGLADYTEGLRNAEGAAQAMADTQNDTVLGAFDAFKSALADVGITIGQQYLPIVRQVLDGATDMVRKFGELDPQLFSMALNFAAVSSGIALATTTIIKLGHAIKGLFVAMGPGGWLIVGLSLLAGAVVSYNMEASKMTEVSLENAEAMIESEAALSGQIERYDELRLKTRLTNEEFGEFMDYNRRIADEVDPDKIAQLKDEQEQLAEKSGLSNAELDEMVNLNNELVAVLPDASTSITEHGNAILSGTDNLKEYNEQQREAIRLELENQRVIAEANYAENLEKRKTLTEEIVGHQQAVAEKTQKIAEVDAEILDTKNQMKQAEAEHDTLQKLRLESHLNGLEDTKQKLLDNRAEEHNIMLEKQGQLDAVELQLNKIDEVDAKLAEVILNEVGLNGTREDGLGLLDEAIKKEQKKVSELESMRDEQGGLNQDVQEEINKRQQNINEYQRAKSELQQISGVQSEVNDKLSQEQSDLDQINDAYRAGRGAIDSKTAAQGGTNAKIDEGTAKAREQNAELGKDASKNVLVTDNGTIADLERRASRPVTKSVTVNEKRGTQVKSVDAARNSPRFANHQGGFPGKSPALADLAPAGKLHSGGLDRLGLQGYAMTGAPQFNEVDVRLLRNEMVLTESQQANLFRMLKAGQTGGGAAVSMAETNALLRGMRQELANMRDLTVMLEGEVVGRLTEPYVSGAQLNDVTFSNTFNGIRGRY